MSFQNYFRQLLKSIRRSPEKLPTPVYGGPLNTIRLLDLTEPQAGDSRHDDQNAGEPEWISGFVK